MKFTLLLRGRTGYFLDRYSERKEQPARAAPQSPPACATRGAASMHLLDHPTRFLFFTGKGGVGKTSVACAAAIALADAGRKVLLVSTDPASNLDEMLAVELADAPRPVPGVPGLQRHEHRPRDARPRPIASGSWRRCARPAATRSSPRSASSSPAPAPPRSRPSTSSPGCSPAMRRDFDHVVFDTAPTGHTLRLLSLPKAWTGFLDGNDRGASCLGPHSGLKMREERFTGGAGRPGRSGADPDRPGHAAGPAGAAGGRAHRGRAAAAGPHEPASRGQWRVHGHATARDPLAAGGGEAQGDGRPGRDAAGAGRLPRDEVPLRAVDMLGPATLRAAARARRRRRCRRARRARMPRPARARAARRRAGAGRPRPDHGHGQGRRRQDDDRRRHRRWAWSSAATRCT